MTTPTIKESLTLAEARTVSAPELGVAPCSASGFWRSPTGENHGRDSRPGDVWCEPGDITDTDRMDWLEHVLCYAMVCLDGKTAMESLPATGSGWTNGQLRAAIDKAILSAPNTKIRDGEDRASLHK